MADLDEIDDALESLGVGEEAAQEALLRAKDRLGEEEARAALEALAEDRPESLQDSILPEPAAVSPSGAPLDADDLFSDIPELAVLPDGQEDVSGLFNSPPAASDSVFPDDDALLEPGTGDVGIGLADSIYPDAGVEEEESSPASFDDAHLPHDDRTYVFSSDEVEEIRRLSSAPPPANPASSSSRPRPGSMAPPSSVPPNSILAHDPEEALEEVELDEVIVIDDPYGAEADSDDETMLADERSFTDLDVPDVDAPASPNGSMPPPLAPKSQAPKSQERAEEPSEPKEEPGFFKKLFR